MGWDAFARNADGTELPRTPVSEDWAPRQRRVRRAFARAAKKVQAETGSCDGLLPHAALDVSACAICLEEATGIDAWGPALTPQEVKAAAKRANWNAITRQPAWAMASAREFLTLCARFGLGVYFSW